ncbi:MAG: ABC transporter substrate-binding protein [Veillonella parvula]|nr:ABC transporter substrate-binding protein [Veillonella parvula]
MFQNLRKSKKLLLIAMTCATFAIAGCGSDTTKTTGDNGTSVTWSETFDGTKTDFAVKSAPTHAVSMSQATTEMMLQLGLEDKMAGTAFKEEEIYPPLQAAYDKVKVLSDKWPSYEVFMSVKPDFATGWPDSFSKRAIPADKMISQKVNIWIPESMLSTKADLETNFSDMIKLGEIFGVKPKAEEWVSGQRLKLIGADNVMSGLGVDKTWAKGSWETVIAQNPDYIIIADYGNSIRNDDDFQQKIEKIKANPQLQDITAVKEGHFIRICNMFCILYITKKVPIQMNWDLFVLLVLHTAYCLESKDVL